MEELKFLTPGRPLSSTRVQGFQYLFIAKKVNEILVPKVFYFIFN